MPHVSLRIRNGSGNAHLPQCIYHSSIRTRVSDICGAEFAKITLRPSHPAITALFGTLHLRALFPLRMARRFSSSLRSKRSAALRTICAFWDCSVYQWYLPYYSALSLMCLSIASQRPPTIRDQPKISPTSTQPVLCDAEFTARAINATIANSALVCLALIVTPFLLTWYTILFTPCKRLFVILRANVSG